MAMKLSADDLTQERHAKAMTGKYSYYFRDIEARRRFQE